MEIITTVGTSLITNYFDKEKNKNVNETYKSFYNDKLRSKSFSEDEWKRLSENNHFSKFKEELKKWIENNKDNSCAEIKTLKKLPKDNTNYHFLTTYTIDGFFVGEILCEYFERDKDKFLHRIEGLQIENAKEFKDKGINNLIAKIKEIKKDNNEVILNISGSYKAIIPILTIIGQIENIPLKYIYEDSDELIEIGKFPVNFDFFIAETYHYYLENKEKIKDLDEKEKNKLNELNLITKEGELTSFGKLFLNYLNNVDFSRDTLGHYYEYKLFYHIFKEVNDDIYEELKDYKVLEIGRKIENGEIDLILKNNDDYVFIEVKSFSKIGKSIDQFEKYINYAMEEKINLKKVILFVYKMDFQNLKNHKQSFDKIKEKCGNIQFSVYYTEIPISKNEIINYKYIFENKLEIKKYKN